MMNKYNSDRSRDKIDSILYRARKNEADKIVGEVFKVCGCFFIVAGIGVIIVILMFLSKLVSIMF